MKNQNRIYKLLLGVALIAELVCFAPDIIAQTNYKDEVIPGSRLEKNLLGMVLMYDQYKKDCFKDSTWVTIYDEDESSYAIWHEKSKCEYNDYKRRWEVKAYRPILKPTFEGFIEWLRKLGAKSN